MKKFSLLCVMLLGLCSILHASFGVSMYRDNSSSRDSDGRGDSRDVGALGMIGMIGYFTDNYDVEIGLTISNMDFLNIYDRIDRTQLNNLILQWSLKKKLSEKTNFLYGASIGATFGKLAEYPSSGGDLSFYRIDSSLNYGLFVGLDVQLDSRVHIRAIYYPLYMSGTDFRQTTTTMIDIGHSGRIGLTYIIPLEDLSMSL